MLKIALGAEEKSRHVTQLKALRALLKICFTLDTEFKMLTTKFYMKFSGASLDAKAINSFDYLRFFEKDKRYNDYLKQLVALVGV